MKIERKKHPKMVESGRGLRVRREDEMFAEGGGIVDTIKNAFTEDAPKKKGTYEDKRPVDQDKAKSMASVFSSDKYAEGGDVKSSEIDVVRNKKKLDRLSNKMDTDKGVHKGGGKRTSTHESMEGESMAGSLHRVGMDDFKKRAKEIHREKLEELRSMPKPKLAEGGMIDDSLEHEEELEHHSSVAAAIMAKKDREMMYQGGVIEDNAEEEMANEEYEDLNESVNDDLDQDLMDMEQPEDSNLLDVDLDSDEHDHIAEMRRKMRIKSIMSK